MSHGKQNTDIVAPISTFYGGKYGRLFPDLPPWKPDGVSDDQLETYFLDIAKKYMVRSGNAEPTIDILGQRNPSSIPAGYTYFGQFVDHDITFDITPLSESEVDPNKLRNFRTPRFDLDCIYGSGPDDQPYLYQHDEKGRFTGKLLTGEFISPTGINDLQRNSEGRAIIGAMRNDESAFVAQFQLAFIRAHNKLVYRAKEKGLANTGAEAFLMASRTLRWLYQWVVWHDFVKRISDNQIHESSLRLNNSVGGLTSWQLGLEDVYDWKKQPFMPIEFSVAAYRFGHSMARKDYQTNEARLTGTENGDRFPLFNFSDKEQDLSGFRPLAAKRLIQWNWFLEMKPDAGTGFPQPADPIDTKLSDALSKLPDGGGDPHSILSVLAARNLVRGVRMKLPSGPDVARKLGFQPIKISKKEPRALWYYILKEAETLSDTKTAGFKLGQVGSTIVCATFAGLLKGDQRSWINIQPTWTPDRDPLLDHDYNKDPGDWTLASIIRMSGLPVARDSFSKNSESKRLGKSPELLGRE